MARLEEELRTGLLTAGARGLSRPGFADGARPQLSFACAPSRACFCGCCTEGDLCGRSSLKIAGLEKSKVAVTAALVRAFAVALRKGSGGSKARLCFSRDRGSPSLYDQRNGAQRDEGAHPRSHSESVGKGSRPGLTAAPGSLGHARSPFRQVPDSRSLPGPALSEVLCV